MTVLDNNMDKGMQCDKLFSGLANKKQPIQLGTWRCSHQYNKLQAEQIEM